MIVADKIACRFGNFRLGPVSLTVNKGEYWILLGPNGAGKSLLVHIIAGLFHPDAGRITIDGVDVTDSPPERRRVGLVFQQSALFAHMTVRENIEYGPRVSGVSKACRERRVEEIVDSLGLDRLLSRPVATLSGGEAQKVAIGRALAVRPAVLLLDEPFGPIDHNGRLALRQELGRIHAQFGLTTLHVTHSREEALALGDACAVMADGSLVQAGAMADVFGCPRTPFVAQFLGVEGNRDD